MIEGKEDFDEFCVDRFVLDLHDKTIIGLTDKLSAQGGVAKKVTYDFSLYYKWSSDEALNEVLYITTK